MRFLFFRVLLISLLMFASPAFASLAWGQQNQAHVLASSETAFDASFSIDWARAEMYGQASFSLAQAGIRLPTGRFLGEDILTEAYPRLLRPDLLSVRYDSNSTLGDLLGRGEIGIRDLDNLSLEAEKTPPSLSRDLTRMIGFYSLSLEKISAFLNPVRRVVSEPARPLIPVQTADYTGIVIVADSELPVHGRITQALAEPCLFPKIWDTNMNLVYERNMFETGRDGNSLMVRYAAIESIFHPTPSGLQGELADLLGPRPLRILARGIFGISPTDLIIDRDDALRILSTDNNRRLLREGRVLLVLDEGMLKGD